MGETMFANCNVAVVEAAMQAGCQLFAGYPLTPTTEALEHASKRFPETGRVFIQAESEVSTINMLAGAAAVGERSMTATAGVGFALMHESLSNMAGMAEFPTFIYNAQRGGPGMGRLTPNQGDYRVATKGGGAGDYRCLVFGPENLQEVVDLTKLAFALADKYRMPAILLTDQMLAGTTEAFDLGEPIVEEPIVKDYVAGGCAGRKARYVGRPGYSAPDETNYLSLVTPNLLGFDGPGYSYEQHMTNLFAKFDRAQAAEQRAEEFLVDDAEIVVVAYGSAARLVRPAILTAREEGIRVGMLRPISLWPFPNDAVSAAAKRAAAVLVVEMSFGQMADDVRLAVLGDAPVHDLRSHGGAIPRPEGALDAIRQIASTIQVSS